MTSCFSDHGSPGTVRKFNVVNSEGVSCQDHFLNWKIPKGRNGKFNFDVALLTKDREETFSLEEKFKTITLVSEIAI